MTQQTIDRAAVLADLEAGVTQTRGMLEKLDTRMPLAGALRTGVLHAIDQFSAWHTEAQICDAARLAEIAQTIAQAKQIARRQ